jgi:hypothetical protein
MDQRWLRPAVNGAAGSAFDEIAVPESRIFCNSSLRFKVHMDQAKARSVPEGPLKIVEEAPYKVTRHIHAFALCAGGPVQCSFAGIQHDPDRGRGPL